MKKTAMVLQLAAVNSMSQGYFVFWTVCSNFSNTGMLDLAV